MKKLIYLFITLIITVLTITSCEDVPMPYNLPTFTKDTTSVTDPAGSGTANDPFNIVAAHNYITAGVNLDKVVYVKGIIASVDDASWTSTFGNLTYYISDNGKTTNSLEVYRGLYLGNAKFTSADQVKVGDTVVVCGPLTSYNGTHEFVANQSYIYSLNGKTVGQSGGANNGTPSGSGTQASPYNVPAALNFISALQADTNSDNIYVKGKVVSITSIDTSSFGNATFYISEDGTDNNKLMIYRCYGLNNQKFTATSTQPKVGDEVVIYGQFVNYKGNTPESAANNAYVYSINGTSSGTDQPGGNNGGGLTGSEMTATVIFNAQTGSVALNSNNYGSQDVATASTWYTWMFNNITYQGARICKAPDTNGGGLQMQGNDTDASKQGFLFNSTPFGTDIKTITITLKVVTSSQYDPAYSVYAGSTAHPTTNAITGTSTNTSDGTYRIYTQTFNLSGGSYKYFTIANDKAGALYIDKIVIALK